MRDMGKTLLLLSIITFLTACSGDSFTSGVAAGQTSTGGGTAPACDPTTQNCNVVAAFISLRLSKQQIQSDGQDSTTITATVLDTNRAAIADVQVDFSANAGMLSSSIVFSDDAGTAVVTFNSDPADASNQFATITATAGGISAQIPVEIIGTTLLLQFDNNSLQIPVGFANVTEQITVVAVDGGGQKVFNAPVAFSILPTNPVVGAAVVTTNPASGVTDTSGEIVFDLTTAGSGNFILRVDGLGTFSEQVFSSQDIALDDPLRITIPPVNPVDPDLPEATIVSGGAGVLITVDAGTAANVTFASSIGGWNAAGGPSTIIVPSGGGIATATLFADTADTGFATVVASDTADANIFDVITVAMSPPVLSTALISIQSDVNVLPLSIGSTQFTANLEATVRTSDADGNVPIFNVPVVFTVTGAPGGGETLSSSFGVTDLNGIVRTQFTSGILPSGQNNVTISATTAIAAFANPTDSIPVVIGGVGGSVIVGTSPFNIIDDDNTSIYLMDMSVQVADSNGAAVSGANVTLSMWPDSYITGTWYDFDPDPNTEECKIYQSGPRFSNEDVDEDLILDLSSVLLGGASEDVNLDNELTPHNSTAGTVPSSVTTDSAGIGFYRLTFLKQYAGWIRVRARGRTKVQGTETTGNLRFDLAILEEEREGCLVTGPQSPIDLTVTGVHAGFADLVGGIGIPAGTLWTIPLFEGAWDSPPVVPPVGSTAFAGIGSVTVTSPAIANYVVNCPGCVAGTVYDDTITFSSALIPCSLAACTRLGASINIRVIVQ